MTSHDDPYRELKRRSRANRKARFWRPRPLPAEQPVPLPRPEPKDGSGNLPRSNVLAPMAKALGVTVGELLGEPKPRRSPARAGRLGQVFEAVSKLPRRQQQKEIEMAEGFLALHQKAS